MLKIIIPIIILGLANIVVASPRSDSKQSAPSNSVTQTQPQKNDGDANDLSDSISLLAFAGTILVVILGIITLYQGAIMLRNDKALKEEQKTLQEWKKEEEAKSERLRNTLKNQLDDFLDNDIREKIYDKLELKIKDSLEYSNILLQKHLSSNVDQSIQQLILYQKCRQDFWEQELTSEAPELALAKLTLIELSLTLLLSSESKDIYNGIGMLNDMKTLPVSVLGLLDNIDQKRLFSNDLYLFDSANTLTQKHFKSGLREAIDSYRKDTSLAEATN